MSIQLKIDKRIGIRRTTRFWKNEKWRVDKRFFTKQNDEDLDWADWIISSRRGAVFRSGKEGNNLFVLIPTMQTRRVYKKLILDGFSETEIYVTEGEVYVRTSSDNLKMVMRKILRIKPKSDIKKRILTAEQKEKLRNNLKKYRKLKQTE